MRLQSLKLTNFKGIRDFTLTPQGEDTSIYAENGRGKTTLADAFYYCLFDKDSLNRKDFDIKTRDESGVTIPGIDHEVEMTLEVDGKLMTLRKVFTEKWTKKRGSAQAEFSGHSTDYFVDGVPVKEKDYKATVDSLIKEESFKLLSNSRYFNEILKPEDRRRILFEMFGDVTDAEVIASDSQLADLPGILNGRAMDAHKKVVAGKRKEINDQLQKIPTRIDEVTRGLPPMPKSDEANLTKLITDLKAERESKQQEKVRLEAGGGIAEQTKKLHEVEGELQRLQNQYRGKVDEDIRIVQAQRLKLQDDQNALQSQVRTHQRMIEENKAAIQRQEPNLDKLREQWGKVNSQEFVYTATETCPTCGQSLPTEQVQAAREKAQADFNGQKAQALEKIQNEGKAVKNAIEELKTDIQRHEEAIRELQARLPAFDTQEKELLEKHESLKRQADSFSAMPEYLTRLEEKRHIEDTISQLRAGQGHQLEEINKQIANLTGGISQYEQALSAIQQRKSGEGRIRELQATQKQLAKDYEELERELYLCEQFTRAKVKLLEDKINARFQMARFQLFRPLINGGIEDICETTYQGVPYSSLSNSERINIGLDVINALADHYGLAAPVFVDNAEAVCRLLPTRGQQIRLYVSEGDEQLRVQYAKEEVTV